MRVLFVLLNLLLLSLTLSNCRSTNSHLSDGASQRWVTYQTGKASWYGGRWHGRKTASGERFNQGSMTAAHKKLPFGTQVRVTNEKNGQTCVVRINDRGPHVRGRVIDLSAAAAKKIGAYSAGVVPVKLEVLQN
ncbi:MAG: septal ring lytic transglycosylase RlpA family protein [Verrucomicrobiaceae bacterium]|nr:septal ring lytic transglycosylase RlpA family protein [Verrucomicrobiaceae bacterium]